MVQQSCLEILSCAWRAPPWVHHGNGTAVVPLSTLYILIVARKVRQEKWSYDNYFKRLRSGVASSCRPPFSTERLRPLQDPTSTNGT
jgi:hypothetical protein